ncbi:methyltransferase domain-containing protein [Sphingomonas glacialis]|nr:class I SAM-dependent methyltransferase [Sphingomonas glacialis]
MLELLAAPGTDEPLSLVVTGYADEEAYSGWLEDSAGKVWARLEAFRFNFVKFEAVTADERQKVAEVGPQNVKIPSHSYTSALDNRFRWTGDTLELDGYLKGFGGAEMPVALEFESDATVIEIIFNAHGWSGIAAIEINGQYRDNIDLFNRENNIGRRYKIGNKKKEKLRLKVYPVGKNPQSQGREILLDGLIEHYDDLITPVYSKVDARNRGGAFRHRFFEIVETLGPDAVIVDVGGGRRQLADPRYINLEYSPFEEPDIFGDATALPFKSGSIDFIYTAAVLEHVRDPLQMGREIHRVLKSGASLIANSAFMQPVHSEGQHFFNLTPYGIDLTFAMFRNRKVWWDTGFASTIRWFVEVTEMRNSNNIESVNRFLQLSEDLSESISEEKGMYIAESVWVEAIK